MCEYSTCEGIKAGDTRFTKPASSKFRSVSLSIFLEMPGMVRCNSPKRRVSRARALTESEVQRLQNKSRKRRSAHPSSKIRHSSEVRGLALSIGDLLGSILRRMPVPVMNKARRKTRIDSSSLTAPQPTGLPPRVRPANRPTAHAQRAYFDATAT